MHYRFTKTPLLMALAFAAVALIPDQTQALQLKSRAELYLQSGPITTKAKIGAQVDNQFKPEGAMLYAGYLRDFYLPLPVDGFFAGFDVNGGYVFAKGDNNITVQGTDAHYDLSIDADVSVALRLGYEVKGSTLYVKGGVGYTQIKEYASADYFEVTDVTGRNFSLGARYGGGISLRMTRNVNVGFDYTYAEYKSEFGPVELDGHLFNFRLSRVY
ncbi:MAG: outer membrane beta-barrel protein [Alphaproteobacteria bacterium GM202ARS2]|nr:outer membrane beta-barrel protein [Alphaproteobacteria bacterium GM202ARS2]